MTYMKNRLVFTNIENPDWASLHRHCSGERSKRKVDIWDHIDDLLSHGNVWDFLEREGVCRKRRKGSGLGLNQHLEIGRRRRGQEVGGKSRGWFHRNQDKGYFVEGVVNGIDAIRGPSKVKWKGGCVTLSECCQWEMELWVIFSVPQRFVISLERQPGYRPGEDQCKALCAETRMSHGGSWCSWGGGGQCELSF